MSAVAQIEWGATPSTPAMTNLSPDFLEARVGIYNYWCSESPRRYPPDAMLVYSAGKICGRVRLGGDYSNISPFPGAYPKQYVARLHVLFPELSQLDETNLLHVCAGGLAERGKGVEIQKEFGIRGTTLDLCTTPGWDLDPDIRADAETFTESLEWAAFKESRGADSDALFDYVMADIPYNKREAKEKYNCKMVSRAKVRDQISKVLRPGGLVLWLDQIEPLHAHTAWNHVIDIDLKLGQGKNARLLTGLEKLA